MLIMFFTELLAQKSFLSLRATVKKGNMKSEKLHLDLGFEKMREINSTEFNFYLDRKAIIQAYA